jgi:hypothetical protein
MGSNPSSRVTAIGLAVMLLGVSAAVGSGELGLLLGLVGVLVGANTIAAGVRRMGEDPTTPTYPAVLGALTAFLPRNLAVVGVMLSSTAVTAVSAGEAGPVFCFAMFTLFLLGLCFMNIQVLGEE